MSEFTLRYLGILALTIMAVAILLSGCIEDDTIYIPVEPVIKSVVPCEDAAIPTWQGAHNYYWVRVEYNITNGVVTQEHTTECMKVY